VRAALSADRTAHISGHPDKLHQEDELTPVFLFKTSAQRTCFLVKAGFSSGITPMFWGSHQCSAFFHWKCSQKGRGTWLCSTKA